MFLILPCKINQIYRLSYRYSYPYISSKKYFKFVITQLCAQTALLHLCIEQTHSRHAPFSFLYMTSMRQKSLYIFTSTELKLRS